ncbi:ATP-binding protein [Streptomyces alboflavus]|uniref:ATP-binding protein n=1 Tax=Streptomyces alboflavus TaxID=67267 RepID=UPI0036CA1D77
MTNPTALPTRNWFASYPLTPASARLARQHARCRLDAWRWQGDLDDAVLVVSELVANAARHGRVVGHHLWLRLALAEDDALIVDVSDPRREFPRFEGGGVASGEGGRGLLVVRQLAHELEWFLRDGQGKTVRAKLPPST